MGVCEEQKCWWQKVVSAQCSFVQEGTERQVRDRGIDWGLTPPYHWQHHTLQYRSFQVITVMFIFVFANTLKEISSTVITYTVGLYKQQKLQQSYNAMFDIPFPYTNLERVYHKYHNIMNNLTSGHLQICKHAM